MLSFFVASLICHVCMRLLMIMVMTMRIWRLPFLLGQRRPFWVIILPWSKDLIRSRGKLWSVSIFSINLLSPTPPWVLESWLACNSHPSCSFIYYLLSDLLFTIKGFPSQGCMQFDIEIALKEATVNGGGSTISWWVEWDVWTGI